MADFISSGATKWYAPSKQILCSTYKQGLVFKALLTVLLSTSSILNTKPKSQNFSVNSPHFLLELNSKENVVLSR